MASSGGAGAYSQEEGGELVELALCRECVRERGEQGEELPLRPYAIDEYKANKKEEMVRKEKERLFEERKKEARLSKETEASTSIQRTFRGYRSRIRNADFVEERKAWMAQRRLDDGQRGGAMYKLLEVMGRAPELESDTLYEKVMKRYPAWAHAMVADVVHGEWQACYNMIKAQEKYRREHGFPSVQDMAKDQFMLGKAQLERFLASRAEKAMERAHNKARQEYRNARSAVGTPEALKKHLQQEMRQRHAKLQEAKKKREAADTAVNDVAAAKARRWGPRGMPKRMRQVRREGWPLPAADVRLGATKGSSHFSHNRGKGIPPGLREGDYIKLSGSSAIYKVVENKGQPPLFYSLYIAYHSAWVRFAARLEGLDASKDEDRQFIESRIPKHTMQPDNLERMKLSRCWTYPDDPDVQVRKLPKLSLGWLVYYSLTRNFKAFPLSQGVVIGLIRFSRWLAKRMRMTSTMFDEDSSSYKRLVRYGQAIDARGDRFAHLLQSWDPWQGKSLKEEAISLRATVGRILDKQKQRVERKIREYQEEQRKAKDPLSKWQDSLEQVEVKVQWYDGVDTRHFGWMKMDLACPIELSREFVHRYLWAQLNERKGSNFLFESAGEPVNQDKENTMRLESIVPQQLNQKTKEAEWVMTLRAHPDLDKAKIEPFDWAAFQREQAEAKQRQKEEDGDLWSDGEEEEKEEEELEFANVIEHINGLIAKLSDLRGENIRRARDHPQRADGDEEEGEEAEGGAEAVEAEGQSEYAEDGRSAAEGGGEEWTAAYDESGYEYFYNSVTGESTYERPPGFNIEGSEGEGQYAGVEAGVQ